MKWSFLLLICGIISCNQHKQNVFDAYIVSISVSNLDTSFKWYKDVLGFSFNANNYEQQKRDFKQVNLKRDNFEIALFKDDTSISRRDILLQAGKRAQGFTQIGFHVSNFDEWEKQIRIKNVRIIGSVMHDPLSSKRTVLITDPDNNMIYISEI